MTNVIEITIVETPIEVEISIEEGGAAVGIGATETPVEVTVEVIETPVDISVAITEAPIEVDITVNEAIQDHDELGNLAFADSGHTGFQEEGDYITTETDPVFLASQAANIDAGDIVSLDNLSGVNTGDQDLSPFLTDAPSDGNTYGRKDGAWAVAAGISAHASLSQLDYASAGHTGFQASLGYTPLNRANNLSDLVNAGTSRGNLGVAIGSDVQAQSAVLDDLNALTPPASDGQMIVATGVGAFAYETGATLRTSIGVDAAGTDNSTDVTLHASATTGGLSISAQEISNRAATNAQTGYTTDAHITAIEANTLKNTNVPTALELGTINATTVSITSDGGVDDVTLAEADTTNAGLLGSDKWDEIVANTVHLGVSSGNPHSVTPSELSLVIGTNVLAEQSIGITDNYLLEVDGSPNSAEYARFTVNGLEGRTEAEFKGDFNLEIGTDVQAYDATLQSISALGATGKMLYTTGTDTWAEATITAAGRAILDDANASDQRTTLGLGALAVLDNLSSFSTTDLSEGSNLYYTDARVGTYGDATYLKLVPQAPILGTLTILPSSGGGLIVRESDDENDALKFLGFNGQGIFQLFSSGGLKVELRGSGQSKINGGNLVIGNDKFAVGTNDPLGKLHVSGDADEIQLLVQAHSTQTANRVEIQDNDGTTIRGGWDKDGVLFMLETTTPTAVDSVGKIYFKSDNKAYVQTGDGVEHEVAFV